MSPTFRDLIDSLEGEFGAMMEVSLVNDGPVTMQVESPKPQEKKVESPKPVAKAEAVTTDPETKC